jgi:hypothetical protein
MVYGFGEDSIVDLGDGWDFVPVDLLVDSLHAGFAQIRIQYHPVGLELSVSAFPSWREIDLRNGQ